MRKTSIALALLCSCACVSAATITTATQGVMGTSMYELRSPLPSPVSRPFISVLTIRLSGPNNFSFGVDGGSVSPGSALFPSSALHSSRISAGVGGYGGYVSHPSVSTSFSPQWDFNAESDGFFTGEIRATTLTDMYIIPVDGYSQVRNERFVDGDYEINRTIYTFSTPEPATFALCGIAVIALVAQRRFTGKWK